MDGTSRTVLHSTGLSAVYGLTLDYDNQVLYWADYSNNRIEKSFTNGSNRVLVTSSGIVDPFGITFYDGKLYWTDFSHNSIYTLDVNTTSGVSRVIGTGQDSYGIHVVTKERQREGMFTRLLSFFCITNGLQMDIKFHFHFSNLAAYDDCLESTCSHVCLLSASHPDGYRCLCPPGLELSVNMTDCQGMLKNLMASAEVFSPMQLHWVSFMW